MYVIIGHVLEITSGLLSLVASSMTWLTLEPPHSNFKIHLPFMQLQFWLIIPPTGHRSQGVILIFPYEESGAEKQGSRLTAVTQEDHIRPEYSLHLGVDLYVGNIPSSNDR